MKRILWLLFFVALSWTVSGQTLYNDGKAGELGTKFSVIAPGRVYGVKFMKGTDAAVYVGKIYDNSGNMLASANAPVTTTSGEVLVYFSSPVIVSSASYYMASFYSPGGNYFANSTWFNSYIPKSNVILKGGYYTYGSGVPNTQYFQSFYYVEPIYSPNPVPKDTVRIRDTIVKINNVHDTTIKVVRDTLRIHDTTFYANACDTAWLYYGYPVDANLIKTVEETNMYEVTLPGNEHIRFHREFAWIRERLVGGFWRRED
jgi:hypothetical protein